MSEEFLSEGSGWRVVEGVAPLLRQEGRNVAFWLQNTSNGILFSSGLPFHNSEEYVRFIPYPPGATMPRCVLHRVLVLAFVLLLAGNASVYGSRLCSDTLLGLSDTMTVGERVEWTGSVRTVGGSAPSCPLAIFSEDFTPTTQQHVVLWGATGALDTAFHGSVLVRAGATLLVKPGTYKIGALTMEWGSTLIVDTSGLTQLEDVPAVDLLIDGEIHFMDGFLNRFPGLSDSLSASLTILRVKGSRYIQISNGVKLFMQLIAPQSFIDLGERSLFVGRVHARTILWRNDSRGRFAGSTLLDDGGASDVVVIEGARRFWTNAASIPVVWQLNGALQSAQATETLPYEGEYWIVRAAGGARDSVLAIVDRTPPSIRIISPANNSVTNQLKVEIRWLLNGEVMIDSSELSEGLNYIQRGSADSAGNSGGDFVNVHLDTQAPSVKIISPIDGFQTNQRSIQLRWSIDEVEQTTIELMLNEGLNTVQRVSTDEAGNVGSAVVNIYLDTQPPEIAFTRPIDGVTTIDSTIELNWTIDGIEQPSEVVNLIEGQNRFERSAQDEVGNVASASVTIIRIPDPDLGRKPILPKVQPGTFPTFRERMQALITGPNAIQFDVVDSAFTGLKVAVFHGIVVDRDGAGLGGVQVSVSGRPEWGWTKTQANGTWNLYAGGGGLIALDFQKSGWLPSQRKVLPRPLEISAFDTVAMVRLDSRSELVQSGSDTDAVLISSTIQDSRGERAALVMVSAGTNFFIRSADGSERTPSHLTLRATEYTVGTRGQAAMPGDLPPGVAYTYAIEVGADGVGPLETVIFDKPVHMLVENFLNFPPGIPVPLGWYDRKNNWWVPESSGVIIQVIAVIDGIAELDVNGDGQAESRIDLINQGWTQSQLQEVGSRYTAGTSLWSVFLPHLTPWDLNWAFGMPDDAIEPEELDPNNLKELKEDSEECGSIIGVQNQILCEAVSLPGTTLKLAYSSQRASGFNSRIFSLPVTFDGMPVSLRRIEVFVDIAGQRFHQRFERGQNQSFLVQWNGLDAFDNPTVIGHGEIRYRYVYPGVYQLTSRFGGSNSDRALGGYRSDLEVYFEKSLQFELPGLHPAGDANIGSSPWLFSTSSPLDRESDRIFKLSGGFESTVPLTEPDETAWKPIMKFTGQGQVHKSLQVFDDGSVCMITASGRIRCIGSTSEKESHDSSFVVLSKGTGNSLVAWGTVGAKTGLFRGDLSLLQWDAVCIPGSSSEKPFFDSTHDGSRCQDVSFYSPTQIAEGPEGDIFIAQYQSIRKITVDGRIYHYAGGPTGSYDWDTTLVGANARGAKLFNSVRFVLPQADGSLLVGDIFRVIRITKDRRIELAMGRDKPYVIPQDYQSSLSELLWYPEGAAIVPGRGLCVIDQGSSRVICKSKSDYLSLLLYRPTQIIPWGMGGNATGKMCISGIWNFGEYYGVWCREEIDTSYVLAPSSGFAARYNRVGQPVQVIEPVFRTRIRTMEYDSLLRLKSIYEDSADTTTLVYPEEGLTIVTGPKRKGAVVTRIERDSKGLVSRIRLADGGVHHFLYDEKELLISYLSPSGLQKSYGYSTTGQLVLDSADGMMPKRLEFQWLGSGDRLVTVTRPSGKVMFYRDWSKKDTTFQVIGSSMTDAPIQSSVKNRWSEIRYPDGSGLRRTFIPDPQWGLAIPLSRDSAWHADGSWALKWTEASVELNESWNPLSMNRRVEIENFKNSGGFSRKLVKAWDVSARTFSKMDELNRNIEHGFDRFGYPIYVLRRAAGDIDTLETFQYSSDRMLLTKTIGGRTDSLWANANGNVDSVHGLRAGNMIFERDTEGKITNIYHFGVRTNYSYDSYGRLLSVKPGGGAEHSFVYGSSGEDSAWIPPGSDSLGGRIDVRRDSKGRLIEQIVEEQSVYFTYDEYNRIARVDIPGARIDRTADGPFSSSYQSMRTEHSGSVQQFRMDRPSYLSFSQIWSGNIAGSVGWNIAGDGQSGDMNVQGQNVGYSWSIDGNVRTAGSARYSRRFKDDALQELYLGNLVSRYTYDSLDRQIGVSTGTYSGTITTENWNYDASGRISKKIESYGSNSTVWDYEYDSLGQLSYVYRNGGFLQRYTYDSNGNRLNSEGPNSTTTSRVNIQDQLTVFGSLKFGYDGRGQLAWRSQGDDTTRFTYDALGNLLRFESPQSRSVEYILDGHNRRIGRKIADSLDRVWLYDGQLRIVAELHPSGELMSRFVYGSRSNVPDYMVRGNRLYRFVSDHLGSVRVVIDSETGEIVSKIDYDVWGNIMESLNAGFQPFGFAGGLRDEITGLIRFGARDYDPLIGRWTARDPLGFSGGQLNLYGYAGNDPVNFRDPDGQMLIPVVVGVALIAIALYPMIDLALLQNLGPNYIPRDIDDPRSRDRVGEICKIADGTTKGVETIDLVEDGSPQGIVKLFTNLLQRFWDGSSDSGESK